MRIGLGEDIHVLVAGRPLKLGGVTIPSPVGELAHSDGDVLLHAIADAIYGAIANHDIGYHFPDTDAGNKNLKSEVILKHAISLAREKGYEIGNLDSTIFLEKPKLSRHIAEIRRRIAKILELNVQRVSVKAKTNEGLGPVGEGKAVRATCIVHLEEEK